MAPTPRANLPIKTVGDIVTYEIPLSTVWDVFSVHLSEILAEAAAAGIKPHQLRIETSLSHGLLIRWEVPS